jgi:hypothetical protein
VLKSTGRTLQEVRDDGVVADATPWYLYRTANSPFQDMFNSFYSNVPHANYVRGDVKLQDGVNMMKFEFSHKCYDYAVGIIPDSAVHRGNGPDALLWLRTDARFVNTIGSNSITLKVDLSQEEGVLEYKTFQQGREDDHWRNSNVIDFTTRGGRVGWYWCVMFAGGGRFSGDCIITMTDLSNSENV